jgi:hypothetical protein
MATITLKKYLKRMSLKSFENTLNKKNKKLMISWFIFKKELEKQSK